MIQAITLIRPMSAAIVWGSKNIENRPRDLPKKMRGVPTIVAVHAGKKFDVHYDETVHEIDGVPRDDFPIPSVPYVCRFSDEGIVGLMLLSGRVYTAERRPCVSHPDGAPRLNPWWSGPYGYEILAKAPFAHQIQCRGALGFWPVPDAIAAVIQSTDGWHALESRRDALLRAT